MSRKCKTVYTAVARPYSKCVNVGNWFEERALEEHLLKDYLYKRENNMLLWQNLDRLKKTCFKDVPLSYSRDQLVRYGDRVMLVNLPITNPAQNIKTLCMHVPESVLYCGCLDPSFMDRPITELCASENILSPVNFSTFVIRGLTAALDGTPVRFGEVVFFYTFNEKLLLSSVKKTPIFRLRNMSENNWVVLTNECNYNCRFRLVPFDKSERLELDGEPVKANARLLVNHVETNENLCVENDILRSAFNTVYDVDESVSGSHGNGGEHYKCGGSHMEK
ncbi:hypothetical protein HELRODRAFT_168787 [Helobdella robusta]|uniref:Uncharacterized protein n=1 Tax=Helobdella robusta TaxID=6412 RepID=T1F0Z0_HELRO|nr:hypothetical protein HELRODRAFT_168787 [Helobdella robusta]ESO08869.1 hypothetical protein HELRODRAFT_168787 [Helobdella robusta]